MVGLTTSESGAGASSDESPEQECRSTCQRCTEHHDQGDHQPQPAPASAAGGLFRLYIQIEVVLLCHLSRAPCH
jgi:hypothetical protein